jgi:transcriptional regulator with XRE-family HTH domain
MVGTATIMPTMPTPLGTLIANERQRLNWSLRDLAAHGGPRHNTLSMIESGDTAQPDAATLWKIAAAFATGSAKMDRNPIEAGE